MRVLFLQRQPCIKTLKYAVGLAGKVELAFAYQGRTLNELYGGGDELFERWYPLAPDAEADLARVIDDFAPDIIHSHNLPDVLTVAAHRVAGGRVPIIHDIHDFQALRKTPYEDGFPDPPDLEATERAAVEDSDALITVSDVLMDEIRARYTVPEPNLVFPNYALLRDLPELSDRQEPADGRPPTVVYQGTISVCGGHYDLRDIFAEVAASGLELHVHAGREPMPEYVLLEEKFDNLHLHGPVPSHELMRVLPRYDLGLAAFNATLNDAHLATVLPNKAFEYVGCGLPVITQEHKALAAWVRDEGTGLVVDDLARLPEALAAVDVDALRARCRENREKYTIEGRIDQVLDLYGRLTSG